MVAAPAAADAIARARRLPSLRVGLHIVLVDGRPMLPPADLPALVDQDGRFRNNMAVAGLRIFLDPAARRQLAAEITAQFEAYAATGLPLDHVDCHKHFHLHPTIAHLVIDIGKRFGMTAMRVPQEPASVLGRIEPQATSPQSLVTEWWAKRLRARVRGAHVLTADRVFGLAWSGAMTEARMAGLLAQLPDDVTEIYTHPATSNAFSGAVQGYRYDEELAALVSPRIVAAAKSGDIALKCYSDLLAA